jgi:hypothetical protein
MIKKTLLLAALTGVALTGTAFAYSPAEAAKPAAPTPRVIASSVVHPADLPGCFAGETVSVEFSLDQKGHPRDILVLGVSDPVLKRQLVDAFRQWRFETGAAAPDTAPHRYILPIQLNPEV